MVQADVQGVRFGFGDARLPLRHAKSFNVGLEFYALPRILRPANVKAVRS